MMPVKFSAVWDEHIAFGRVVVEGSRFPVGELADRFVAGDALMDIALDMGLPSADLERALRLFLLALPGRRGLKVETKMRELLAPADEGEQRPV